MYLSDLECSNDGLARNTHFRGRFAWFGFLATLSSIGLNKLGDKVSIWKEANDESYRRRRKGSISIMHIGYDKTN